jgi:hypothetical protein
MADSLPEYEGVELPHGLAGATERLPEHRYGAIVVDEAQDIDAVWWLPLLDLLEESRRTILRELISAGSW